MFCALLGSTMGSGLRDLSRRLWSSVALSPVWADYGGLAQSLCVVGLLSLAPIVHLRVPHDSYEWCWSLEAEPEPRVWVPSCEGALMSGWQPGLPASSPPGSWQVGPSMFSGNGPPCCVVHWNILDPSLTMQTLQVAHGSLSHQGPCQPAALCSLNT